MVLVFLWIAPINRNFKIWAEHTTEVGPRIPQKMPKQFLNKLQKILSPESKPFDALKN